MLPCRTLAADKLHDTVTDDVDSQSPCGGCRAICNRCNIMLGNCRTAGLLP